MFRRSVGKILRILGIKKVAMQHVVQELYKRGVNLKSLDGIELFGRDGGWSTDFISKELNSIDIVEISSEYENILKSKYKDSNIYIDNTYEFIKNKHKKYDLILSDNPASKHGDYFQHFSLFPGIFNLFHRKTILILNIIPDYSIMKYNPNKEEENRALKEFYNMSSVKISTNDMIETYNKLAQENDFLLVDYFVIKRGTGVEYLCLFFEENHE